MKKLTAIILAAAMLALAPVSVFADVIDWVLYTDIRTYIGGVEITSYNIKGNTAVVVEDLKDYGFKVVWDGDTRTLSVARDAEASVAGGEVTRTEGEVGARAMEVYSTDIVTYLDGNVTESYNVGGRTIVYVDALAALYSSEYYWDPDARTLTMTLSGSVKAPEPKPETAPAAEKDYVIENGVYVNKAGGFSFPVNGEYEEGVGSEYGIGGEISSDFMMYSDDPLAVVYVYSYDLDDEMAALSEEDLAAAFSEIESGAEEAPEGAEDIVFSSAEIAGKKWITMDMTGMMGDIEGASDLGLTIKMYLRKFDAKLIYIMVMAADSEAADAFIATIEPAE